MSSIFTPPLTARSTRKHGFTVIELLVVTTIMIVLSTLGLVSYTSTSRKARNSRRHADLEMVRSALVLYRTDNLGYPGGDFSTMVSTLFAQSYLTNNEVLDPKNTGVYSYTYTANNCVGVVCKGFQLCAYDEPDPGTQFCLSNP